MNRQGKGIPDERTPDSIGARALTDAIVDRFRASDMRGSRLVWVEHLQFLSYVQSDPGASVSNPGTTGGHHASGRGPDDVRPHVRGHSRSGVGAAVSSL